jgi:hypothetical protein
MRGDLSDDLSKHGIIQRSLVHLFHRLTEHDYSDIKVKVRRRNPTVAAKEVCFPQRFHRLPAVLVLGDLQRGARGFAL